jgi:hypothetical protein
VSPSQYEVPCGQGASAENKSAATCGGVFVSFATKHTSSLNV